MPEDKKLQSRRSYKRLLRNRKINWIKHKVKIARNCVLSIKNRSPKIKILATTSLHNLTYRAECLRFIENVMLDRSFELRDYVSSSSLNLKDPVFTFWDEGVQPDVVKICIGQMKKVFGDRLIVLSKDNMSDYVCFDPKIIQHINVVQFSDLLRLALLYFHGGTWIDSTVWINRDFNNNSVLLSENANKWEVSTWYLRSEPRNYVMYCWLSDQILYWLCQKSAICYSMVHHFFEMRYHLDARFKRIVTDEYDHFDRAEFLGASRFMTAKSAEIFKENFGNIDLLKLNYREHPLYDHLDLWSPLGLEKDTSNKLT